MNITPEIMIGRDAETAVIEGAILTASNTFMFQRLGFHISGAEGTGKTQLVRHVMENLTSIDNVVCVGPDAELAKYSAYPIDELVTVRDAMKKACHRFDSDLFDLAVTLFEQKFDRRGRAVKLSGVERPLAEIFHASFGDTAKKGAEDTLTDIKNWAANVAAAGGGVGGAVKAGGFFTGLSGGLTLAGVASVAASAAVAGAATLTTAAGGRLVYHLVKGMRLRSRNRKIRELFPDLERIITTPRNSNDFLAYLAYMLADAIKGAHDGERGYIPVLFLDPGDDLAQELESPMARLGRVHAQVLDALVHKVVIATSRTPLTDWSGRSLSARTAPNLEYQPIVLGNIPLGEAERWCKLHAYEGAWPPPKLDVCGDGTCEPPKLGKWWQERDLSTPEDEVA